MLSFIIFLKSEPLGIYYLINLFVFSIVPFCHEEYESVKYTIVFKAFAIFS